MHRITEDIIIRAIQKKANSEELSILNQWLKEDKSNAKFYFQLEEVWSTKGSLSKEEIQIGWKMITKQISLHTSKVRPIRQFNPKQKWLSHVAAIFIGALVSTTIWISLAESNNDSGTDMIVQNIAHNNSGVLQVTLPDNSVIWINEKSTLTYPELFTGNTRPVKLEGKAYFDIKKDHNKPFTVQIGKAEIEVTGTEFFVESTSDEEATITLISGGINLHHNNLDATKTVTLTPGEQAVLNYENESIEIENVSTDYYVAFKDGTYRFTDESIYDIATILSKHYDIDIHVSNSLKENRFTGRVTSEMSIDKVLSSMKLSYPINYKITDDKVYIIG